MSGRALLRTVLFAPLLLCAVNTAVVCAGGGYDLSLGPLHVGSHSAFKAILQMEGAFLFALVSLGLVDGGHAFTKGSAPVGWKSYLWPALLISVIVCAAYAPSLAVHFHDHDWNHRHVSADIHSWADAAKLFTKPQVDGFYRPMTFLSLLLDYRAFGDQGWGYHLQSIGFHILNCLLLLALARSLGLSEAASRWAAVLFAVAAVNFEPVLWPAARFDLMATAGTLAAFVCGLRYLDGARFRWAAASAGFLIAGILNKESAYCFPLVIGCLLLFWRTIKPGPIPVRRAVNLAAVVVPAIGMMILVRLAVFRGLGGYPPLPESSSPHYSFTFKTLLSLFTRPPVALLGVNSAVALPMWLVAAIIAFAAAMTAAVWSGARANRGEMVMLLCVLLSAIPTLNIINWIGPSMQQTRYLYMPGIWLTLFTASVLSRGKWAVPLLTIWAAANLAGAEHNVNVYRAMLEKIGAISEQVRKDASGAPGAATIGIRDLAEQPNGVFFGGSELIAQIQAKLPQASIRQVDLGVDPGCPDLLYRWNNSATDLEREVLPAACPAGKP